MAPSEYLSRPGTIWWTRTDPDALIPTWTVPGTMFHEGVPGHHLQLGTTALNTTTLNRFQRLACELHPGHCGGGSVRRAAGGQAGVLRRPRAPSGHTKPPVSCCARRGSSRTSACP
ncbi:DUF885 family protein [Streptomyces cyaneofuscatus]|uniref:DUF885 family protein n=1 Tax=Streptomyces cyaneofuscatus TaxID=66883 RepID=UPI0033FE0A98